MKKLILLMGIFILGCMRPRFDPDLEIQKEILRQITIVPYFATMQIVYGVDFLAYEPNLLTADDFYIRKDVATVFYGISLNSIKTEIQSSAKDRVLKVRVPRPKLISVDRKIAGIYFNDSAYQPGIDPDKELNKSLEETITKNEERVTDQALNMTRLFFTALAHRFNLTLEFSVKQVQTH